MRVLVSLLAFAVLIAGILTPQRAHLPLDPNEPIAADGSLTAGRARTIFDVEPLLGAFDDPQTTNNADDPRDFEVRINIYKRWMDRSRKGVEKILGTVDVSQCEEPARKELVAAVRLYYAVRGSQKASFALRGPRARSALEQEWSTPLDQQIDSFVRRAIRNGYLHKDEFPARRYPEFAKVFADTPEIGATCPPLKIQRGAERL